MKLWLLAGTLVVALAGCGSEDKPSSEAVDPSTGQPRYKVSESWCEEIDYEALADKVKGRVMFPDDKSGRLIGKIQLECTKSVFDIAPDGGMVNIRVVAYTYETVELAEDRFWKSPSPQEEGPRLSAEVDRVTFGELGEARTIRVLDSNLTIEVIITAMPNTPAVPVELLEDFTDHVIGVIRADPGL